MARMSSSVSRGQAAAGNGIFAAGDRRPKRAFAPSMRIERCSAFAGIWTEFKGDRGTKSKPIPAPHLAYGSLTTEANWRALIGW
jgi:hypothetical protein